MIATLPMYDWPERRAETDALWARLAIALRNTGFDAPDTLERRAELVSLWLAPDLLLGETCTYPLETTLRDRVRYVATPIHAAPGSGLGTYRSAIIAAGEGAERPPPDHPGPDLPDVLDGRWAINAPESMSGYVALRRDLESVKRAAPAPHIKTGSHRASIHAVANGDADFATIDCVTWRIARQHEPAAQDVRVIGWTAARPGLPLITNAAMTDAAIEAMRGAIVGVMPITVLDQPTEY